MATRFTLLKTLILALREQRLAAAGLNRREKRGRQDRHTEISSETRYSVDTNYNHTTYDTGEEDLPVWKLG